MTNEAIIAEIDKALAANAVSTATLTALRTSILLSMPVPDPKPAPTPAPAPPPTPPPTTALTATLLGREGDYTSGPDLKPDGKLDVHIRLTGCPTDISAVTIRDGHNAGCFWTHNAKNSWIIAMRPAPGGVCDLYFTHAGDFAKYTVDVIFYDGTAAVLNAVPPASSAGPAPLPAPDPTPPPAPVFPAQPTGNRTGRIPYTDQYCSAIMDGLVVCNIVLLESDSTTHTGTAWDEDWSDAEKDAIFAQAMEAALWWEEAFSRAIPNAKHRLRFQINAKYLAAPVTVSYEPITTRFADRALWMRQAMERLGYPGSDYLANCRRFNHASRVAAGADWAFTMFVIDSQNDSDGKFADGFSNWAHFNGPCCYLTSDAGAWGSDRLWRCMVHEWAHVFGPRDTYAGSGSKYTDTMGYLYKVQNTNAIDGRPAGAPPQVPDIMAGASMQDASLAAFAPCLETRWALGWIDSDHDGILDARGK